MHFQVKDRSSIITHITMFRLLAWFYLLEEGKNDQPVKSIFNELNNLDNNSREKGLGSEY